MNFWLMKNEPEDYDIDDLARDKTEPWDGIRNYQVRNMIRDEMRIGDNAFFYHSNCETPGIYGQMTICKEAYADHTAFDKKAKYYDPKSKKDAPTWLMVDVKYKRKMKNTITLKELKRVGFKTFEPFIDESYDLEPKLVLSNTGSSS